MSLVDTDLWKVARFGPFGLFRRLVRRERTRQIGEPLRDEP
jgi:hypothetical protein